MKRGNQRQTREMLKRRYSIMSNSTNKKEKPEESEDTKNRRALQEFIDNSVREGYSDEDIMAVLNVKYPKYSDFFESWITNKRKQYTSSKNGRDRSDD